MVCGQALPAASFAVCQSISLIVWGWVHNSASWAFLLFQSYHLGNCLSVWARWMTFSLRPDPVGARHQSFICKGRCWQPEIASLNFSTLKMVIVLYWLSSPGPTHCPFPSLHFSLHSLRLPWESSSGSVAGLSLPRFLCVCLGKFTENTWPWDRKM